MTSTAGRMLAAAGALGAAGFVFLASTAGTATQEEPEYIGSDLCAECHTAQYERFEGTVHDTVLTLLADEPTAASGCEACHGPGLLHVEMAGTEEPGFRAAMNAQPDPETCFACHVDVQGQFGLPERHPVLQGFMTCSDCHDPHGTFNLTLRREAMNDTCTDCHTDKQGPWLFPHAVAEIEGCVACHQPHGSVNPHMLPYRETTFTCLSCHPSQPAFHTQPRFADCTSCHFSIHGSNLDPFFRQ